MSQSELVPPVPPSRTPSPNPRALPTSAYTRRMPDMPRVGMPFVYRRGSAQPLIVGPPVHNPDPSLNVDFLNFMEYSLIEPMEFHHWGYDLRRKAQLILPFLFVAPMNMCREKDFLKKNGITMLVGIHPSDGAQFFTRGVAKAAEANGIEHHVLPYDHASVVIHSFSHANFLINSHLARLKDRARVAVYCHSGNETSPVFIAAYLMETFQGMTSAERAMSVVLTKRFCVHYDEDARRMLKAYEDILSARNQVLGTTLGAIQGDRDHTPRHDDDRDSVRLASLKRLRDGMLHNVADDYFEDRERFQGREFAPFRDEGEALDIGEGTDQASEMTE